MTSVKCNLVIEKIGQDGAPMSNHKFAHSEVAVVRNQNGQLCLSLQLKNRDVQYRISSLKIHAKFMKEGKATLTFDSGDGIKRVLISNAAFRDLENMIKLLLIKQHTQALSKNKPCLSSQIDAISPIRPREIAEINSRLNPGSPTSKDTTPVRRLKRRRLAAEQEGLIQKRISRPERILSDTLVSLNKLQQDVIRRAKSSQSLFFTGAAGTGKSFVLKELIKSLPRDSTAVTASTGCAAVHVNGQTLHGWAGVGIQIRPLKDVITMIRKNKKLLRNWAKTEILIIDEVSMIDAKYFDYLESIARQLKDIRRPFGGIQLILCGDFLQLPPISKDSGTKFCFEGTSWDDCIDSRIELREVYRQASDPEFCKLLNNVRVGQVPKWAEQRLKDSYKNHEKLPADMIPTRLMTHNKQVEALNKMEYEKLATKEVVYNAIDSIETDKLKGLLDKLMPNVPRVLKIKVNAQVMLTRNISVKEGLVNGSRGVVIGFSDDGSPIIRFFTGDIERKITKEKFAFDMGGAVTTRTQYPIVLAWAMSIHKSQGMSLDLASVSLARCFEAGQAYVALSRCRSFIGLRVVDYDTINIRANQAALRFHNF